MWDIWLVCTSENQLMPKTIITVKMLIKNVVCYAWKVNCYQFVSQFRKKSIFLILKFSNITHF